MNYIHRKLLIKGYFTTQAQDPQSQQATPQASKKDDPENQFIKLNKPASKWLPSQKDYHKIPIAIRIFAEDVRFKLTQAATIKHKHKQI